MIVSIGNEKGGVSKTTVSMVLGVTLAKRGYRVLMMDLDQQCNLTNSMVKPSDVTKTSVDILLQGASVEEALIPVKGLDFVPAGTLLKVADIRIMTERQVDGAFILKKELEKVKDRYDFIILDTPRGSGMVTINAFTASDRVLLTTVPEVYAIQGILDVLETIQGIRDRAGTGLTVDGILINRFRGHTILHKHSREFLEKIAEENRLRIYDSIIRESIVVATAQARRMIPSEYDRNAEVSRDFEEFVDEFLRGVGHA